MKTPEFPTQKTSNIHDAGANHANQCGEVTSGSKRLEPCRSASGLCRDLRPRRACSS